MKNKKKNNHDHTIRYQEKLPLFDEISYNLFSLKIYKHGKE